MKQLREFIALTCLSTMMMASAQAGPPHRPDLVSEGNRWTITAYTDAAGGHTQLATQTLCFFNAGVNGTQQLYNWVSISFPNWNGRAAQEGDQVFMHGDYANNVGHDGMEWEIVTASPKNIGSGHWKEWRENGQLGSTIVYANAKFERVGRCQPTSFNEALAVAKDIPLKVNILGTLARSPLGFSADEIKNLTDQQVVRPLDIQ